MTFDIPTKEAARILVGALNTEWWTAYCKDSKSQETTDAKAALAHAKAISLEKFGKRNVQHPECQQCYEQSVFRGGPSHAPSSRCRSGQRPHCSCDTCF